MLRSSFDTSLIGERDPSFPFAKPFLDAYKSSRPFLSILGRELKRGVRSQKKRLTFWYYKDGTIMAHSTHVASLTQDLVRSTLTGPRVEEFKRVALNTFAKAPSGRTNQFDVGQRLAGLEEKARILNNDPLADAIRERLDELSSRSDKWTPEVLSFLLSLSDRPVHNSNLENLFRIRPVAPPAPLTWSDILHDDPLDDQESIWEDVDFRDGGSSDEEGLELDLADIPDDSVGPGTPNHEVITPQVETLIEPHDQAALDDVIHAQFWKLSAPECADPDLDREVDQPNVLLTESQAFREVLFMLLGLPTSIYCRSETDQIVLSRNIVLQHVSQTSTAALLESFAVLGNKLLIVRGWVRRITDIPLVQTFQASLALRLQRLDDTLTKVQERVLDHRNEAAISLLHLYDEVSTSSRLLQKVSDILANLTGLCKSKLPFKILEYLFDETCTKQMIGDSYGYEYMGRLFFDCLNTYLRPIQRWMENGQLDDRDGTMFIKKNPEDVPLSSLWQDQFHLVKDESGNLHAPIFLHLAARKIFNSGRSVDLLRRLGYDEPLPPQAQCYDQPTMSFEKVCGSAGIEQLDQFPLLFDTALDRWVAGIYHSLSSTLRKRLETDCGLQRSLDTLENLYFCPSMPFSNSFSLPIFERIERGHRICHFSDTLTELLQNVFRQFSCVDINNIEVRPHSKPSHQEVQSSRRHMGALENIGVNYILPWPIANIVRLDSIETYQRIFVFLLQLQRAKYLLQRQKLKECSLEIAPRILVRLYAIRHRLLWFTNTILTYLTDLVLSTNTARMRASMKLAVDVDGMVKVHKAYITQIEKQCFLTKQQRPLHQAVVSLLDLTIVFSDIQETFMRSAISKANPLNRDLSEQSAIDSTKRSADADSSEDSDSEEPTIDVKSKIALNSSKEEKLHHINDTFSKLLGFLTAALRELNKADTAPGFEILAGSLMTASE